jgi:replicative DNA helicase
VNAAAELARRGAELARGRKHRPSQLPPVGPLPAAELLLLGALLWSRPDLDPGPVLALVADDELADPALAHVLGVIRSMIDTGQPVGPVMVLDELERRGGPSKQVGDRLLAATTSGAVPEVLRQYAAAVVAAALRRRMESAGAALCAAAESMAEADLAPVAERAVAAVTACAARLAQLRGGESYVG